MDFLHLHGSASVCALTNFAFGNTPLRTDLPALEGHATSAWEPFCSPYWNRMRSCVSVFPFLSPMATEGGKCLSWISNEPFPEAVRKSQPNAALMMMVRSHTCVRHCNWENIWQIAVLIAPPPAPSDARHAAPRLFLSERPLEGSAKLVWCNWSWEGTAPLRSRSRFSLYAHDELFAAGTLPKHFCSSVYTLTWFIFDGHYFSKLVNQVTLSL